MARKKAGKKGSKGNGAEPVIGILKREEIELASPLTDAQRIERGQQLAQVLAEFVTEDSRAELIKQEVKAAKAALEARRDKLRVIVAHGEELRLVTVEHRADYSAGRCYTVRTDTGETIGDRILTALEAQVPMGMTTPETKAAADALADFANLPAIPCSDGEWRPDAATVELWRSVGLEDAARELQNMRSWIEEDPENRRKPKRGAKRWASTWVSKALAKRAPKPDQEQQQPENEGDSAAGDTAAE